VRALAVDGTSATLLLCARDGTPVSTALMYNDARSQVEAAYINDLDPTAASVATPTSSLAKLLYLRKHTLTYAYALHQADWIAAQLSGVYGVSDENNALKLGYDARAHAWPDWLIDLKLPGLPRVVPAATALAPMRAAHVAALGWSHAPLMVSGTTDSTAAFLASGARENGEAVTTLGSTLVMKILSEVPLQAPQYGIYSHRLHDGRWLVGGASNSGGAVLSHYFSRAQIVQLSARVQPAKPSGLDYYPLLRPGERFPFADLAYAPRLSPRPSDDVLFFQGMLEGMAEIERLAYAQLQALGAPPLRAVYSSGGGASNLAWQEIRQHRLGVPVFYAVHNEAAYGSARLALIGYVAAMRYM
jgi:D-ribulokinase